MVACLPYLKGVCDPAVTKIKIIRDNETGEIFCNTPSSCPECSFETEPLCVSFCEIGALTISEIHKGIRSKILKNIN